MKKMALTSLSTIAPVKLKKLISAGAAGEGQDPGRASLAKGSLSPLTTAKLLGTTFENNPLSRAMLAIRRKLPKGILHILMLRLTALGGMTERREADCFISGDVDAAGQARMSRAMFAAAAEMPPAADLFSGREYFFRRLAQAYAEHARPNSFFRQTIGAEGRRRYLSWLTIRR
jgi:hypothetical protein